MEHGYRTAGNESTGLLKVIALVFMCCDHFGKMLFPQIPELRIIGRLAFPLYAWTLVVGCCYTKSYPKYILRLLAVGIVSEFLYIPALAHETPVAHFFGVPWYYPNIFLTLSLGVLMLWGVRSGKRIFQVAAPVGCVTLALLLQCDYGWKGILFILLLYVFRKDRTALAVSAAVFCLWWGSNSSLIHSIFGLRLYSPGLFEPILVALLRLQGLMVLALPLILWRPGLDIRLPKWLSYSLYPLHLLILLLIENVL